MLLGQCRSVSVVASAVLPFAGSVGEKVSLR